MIGQSLAHMDIAALQKAVLGMNPAIKPYAALAALQEKVKSEQMKQGQAMQNPAQPPVAEQMMAQAQQLSPAQINNPYMASGLGAAPVQSPVQAPTANMASGGIIAFDHGGEVPRYGTGDLIEQKKKEQLEEDRASLFDKFGRFGTAAKDMITLPYRAAAGALNTAVVRPARALTGADIPYLFESNPEFTNSATPFYDEKYNKPEEERKKAEAGWAKDAEEIKKKAELEDARQMVDASKGETVPTKTDKASVAGATSTAVSAAKGKKGVAPAESREGPVGIAQAATGTNRFTAEKIPTAEEFFAARKKAEEGADKLPEDEYTKTLRTNLEKRNARLDKLEKRGDQMAALQSAGAFFGPGNLAQNAQKGIPLYADAKIRANSAFEAAQDKATDAEDAWARYNQARQDNNKKDAREAFKDFNVYTNQAKTLNLTGKHYQDTADYQKVAGQAAMITANAAQTRAGALANYDKGALTQFQQGKLLDMANDNVQKLLDGSPLIMLKAQKAAKEAGQSFDPIAYRNQLVQTEIRKMQQSMAGGNTMAPASPAGGGSGARFLGFE
jgi:hypothetical protein